MASSDFPETERRRSVRTKLAIPVRIHGQTRAGEKFTAEAETHTVSDSGCLIYLEASLFVDQTLVVSNGKTGKSVKGRVVSTWRHPGEGSLLALNSCPRQRIFGRANLQAHRLSIRLRPWVKGLSRGGVGSLGKGAA